MPTNGPSGSGMQKFGSARRAAGRRPPSVRLSKCFCGRLQIVPKAPPVKKSEHSARWGPPNSRRKVPDVFCVLLSVPSRPSSFFPTGGCPRSSFGSARLAAGRRPPSVRLSKCFCGRLQIVPKAPPVKKSEHSARRGPPNSRGTVVHGFPFFESRFRELGFF